MREPHQPPSRREVKKSGTAGWVQQAVDSHSQQQQEIASIFAPQSQDLERQQQELQDFWKQPAGSGSDQGPDLFAQEREKADRERRQLAGLWDEAEAQLQSEQESLRGIFGSKPSPPKGKKR